MISKNAEKYAYPRYQRFRYSRERASPSLRVMLFIFFKALLTPHLSQPVLLHLTNCQLHSHDTSLEIRGSFSAGSTPIFASKYAFFRIFRDLQENHLLTSKFCKFLQNFCKILQKKAKFSKRKRGNFFSKI